MWFNTVPKPYIFWWMNCFIGWFFQYRTCQSVFLCHVNCIIMVGHAILEPWIKKGRFVQKLLDALIIVPLGYIFCSTSLINLQSESLAPLLEYLLYAHNWPNRRYRITFLTRKSICKMGKGSSTVQSASITLNSSPVSNLCLFLQSSASTAIIQLVAA